MSIFSGASTVRFWYQMVVLIPHITDPAELFADEYGGIEPVARSLGLPVIDLRGTFAGHQVAHIRVGPTNSHPNVRGHAMLADRFFEQVAADASLTSAVAGGP
jgi:hypothetical protein